MSAPAISVLMPVYNAERYVAEAVESILAQTFRDFEFIIVDDGSKDGSLKILQEYEKIDNRIRLISRPNAGIVVTLNEMLDMTKADLVARMDADDVSQPERFEKQLRFLQEHSECVAVGSRALLIDLDGETIGRWDMPTEHEIIDRSILLGNLVMIHPSLMLRRNAMVQIGGYRREYQGSEDCDLLIRLAEIGKLANITDVLIHYRRHSSSITHSNPKLINTIAEKVIKDAWERRGLGKPPEWHIPNDVNTTAWNNHMKWAWYSLLIGNVKTARKHAKRSLLLKPFSLTSWRVAFCALRGY